MDSVFSSLKKNQMLLGAIVAVVSAVGCFALTWVIFLNEETLARMQDNLFDCGIDVLGTFVCAALFFGTMKQDGAGARVFRILIVVVSLGFLMNALFYFTMGIPSQRILAFLFALFGKLIDLVLIWSFYRYIRIALEFKGRLAGLADRGIPILLAIEVLIILSNIIYPTTFLIDTNGMYQYTPVSAVEDVFLIVTSIVTTILIIKSESLRNQKAAALTFLFLPVFNYVTTFGEFGNASNYGMILMSLIIMYCIIFNYNSSKLAATQTELNMATEIQAGMLPSVFPPFPDKEEFDLYASMDPAKEVGGDFYDFFMIDDDHLAVVIADVSGKGIPAALFMMISKTVVRNFAMLKEDAAEVLRKSNEALCVQNKMEMFVTTWIGILEISTGSMNCANAGHEYPAIYHHGRFELLKDRHGFVLGGMEGAKYKSYEIQLNKGDKIFVYTDGVPEATNANHELFGTDRMMDALNSKSDADPKEILRTIRASVDGFVGNAEQFDDLAMLCLEYKGTN